MSRSRPAPSNHWVSRLGDGGRVVVPAEIREALHLKPGDAIAIELKDNQVILTPQSEVIRALQKKYGKLWESEAFSADSFLKERKAMWGEE